MSTTRADTERYQRWGSWLLLCIAAALVYSLLLGERGYRQIRSLQAELAGRGAEAQHLIETNAGLRSRLAGLRGDLRAVEAEARTQLGFVQKDEVVLILQPSASHR